MAKLVTNDRLREYVQDRLAGVVEAPDGRVVGPDAPVWKGRNKPHRKDRQWVQAWSPEQIANRLKLDVPDDDSMRISHEAIYQALYVEGRGALKRDLTACLRTGRALRIPKSRAKRKAWAHVTPEVMISERPAEAEDRAVPGHWEGDLLIGLERSAVGTLVERTTRFTLLVHLPREEGYRHKHTPKNGPALAGYGAVTMKNALASSMSSLPEQLRRSLTWDRGKELSAHAAFRVETGIPVYFADPRSPWQRGTNENANGLLRQYFPKGTDLSRWDAEEIAAVAAALRLVEPGQFRSRAFRAVLKAAGLNGSMGRVAAAADNAAMESFFSLLQKNVFNQRRSRTREELISETIVWIEHTYNHRRRQRGLGKLTPVEFELAFTPPPCLEDTDAA